MQATDRQLDVGVVMHNERGASADVLYLYVLGNEVGKGMLQSSTVQAEIKGGGC